MDQQCIIVGLGEVLWDVYPDGPRFGGAPANFACSAASLGQDRVDVFMASSVGNDELGGRALEALRSRGVNTSHVSTQDKPTGQVLVELDEQGRASYEFVADTAWDNLEWTSELEQLAARTDAVCFGTLAQRSEISHQTIRTFISATPPTSLRILDVNLRSPYDTDSVILESLELANVLKLSDEELPALSSLCGGSGSDVEILQHLAAQYQLQIIALTRGPQGALLISETETSDQAAVETQLIDTVGAGDAFTATLALGLLQNNRLADINRQACKVAAYVCSQNGATPSFPDELIP